LFLTDDLDSPTLQPEAVRRIFSPLDKELISAKLDQAVRLM
jgi:hypothetical protein